MSDPTQDPMATSYCTMEDVQRETGNSDESLIEWFTQCALDASRWIDDYCYRDFLTHDFTTNAYRMPDDDIIKDCLFLRNPIVTLTEIKVGEIVVDPVSYSFEVGKRVVKLLDGSAWRSGKSADKARDATEMFGNQLSYGSQWTFNRFGLLSPIYVKGTFGGTPASVRMACRHIAASWSMEKRRERMNRDGQRVSIMDENIPSDALRMLTRFRRLVN